MPTKVKVTAPKPTAKEKAAKKAAAAAGDISAVEGTPHVVEFDHTYDNSEPIMGLDPKTGKQQYTGHDKQVRTTEHHERTYANKQLAEAFVENHAKYPEHGVTNVKVRKA